MKKAITFTFLILGLFSCKKEILKTKAQGTVFDLKYKLPLAHVRVDLIESDLGQVYRQIDFETGSYANSKTPIPNSK